MLALVALTAVTAFAPASGLGAQRGARVAVPSMAADRKLYAFDEDIVFEAREIKVARRPVFLLKSIEELRLATGVAELGLLSKAESAGVFSKLEGAGAFSLAEKILPTIENLKLLSYFERLLEVEAGLLFTTANFLIVTGPVLFALQICGFLPFAEGPIVAVEALFDAATLASGAALFATAFIISKLQLAADAES